MTCLQNGLGNSRFGSTITREEGLAPSRRPFENGTNWTHVVFFLELACFDLSISNKMDATVYCVFWNYLTNNHFP